MNDILLIIGGLYIYRHGVIMGAAIAAAIVCAYILAGRRGLPKGSVGVMALFSLILCPLLARAVYWYCCAEQYSGLRDALLSFGDGGYSMLGVLAGVVLAALLTKLVRVCDSTAALLDVAAPAGALGICIGRLAAFFTDDDKSKIVFASPALRRLPFSVLVTDMATGSQEWRFATFIFESLAAFLIFIVLTALLLRSRTPRDDGCTVLMFCVLYGTSQLVLESTRYDSLFLRSNGFVSLMQIVGAIMMVAGMVIFSRRAIALTGYRRIYLAYWLTALALTGITGFLEYFVQRHADKYAMCYPIMALCMLAVCAIAYIIGVLVPNDQAAFGAAEENWE